MERKLGTLRPILIQPWARRVDDQQGQGWVKFPFQVRARGNSDVLVMQANTTLLLRRQDESTDMAIPWGWQLPAFRRGKRSGFEFESFFLSLEFWHHCTLSATDPTPSPKLLWADPPPRVPLEHCRIGTGSAEALIRSAKNTFFFSVHGAEKKSWIDAAFCGGLRRLAAYPLRSWHVADGTDIDTRRQLTYEKKGQPERHLNQARK
jgi:hypothetical protein